MKAKRNTRTPTRGKARGSRSQARRGAKPQRGMPKGVPFAKGFDPRRNLKGRPKSHDELRRLLHEVLALETKQGLTLLQTMLIGMITAGKPEDRKHILEHAYGKVKDVVEANVNLGLVAALEDVSKLSDDERRSRIAELLDRGRAAGAGPVPGRATDRGGAAPAD